MKSNYTLGACSNEPDSVRYQIKWLNQFLRFNKLGGTANFRPFILSIDRVEGLFVSSTSRFSDLVELYIDVGDVIHSL